MEDPQDEDPTEDAPAPLGRPSRPSLRRISRASFLLELETGTPVGEYEIQSQIGEGAMGTVYTAVHPLIGKTVAIKVLKPEVCTNQASIDRFVQEAQAVNRIGHPNIVDVFSLGELPDGRAYMVMEWLRGEDLKARLRRGPLQAAEACAVLDGIARALEAAHAKEIIHRDLKPDNVYLHQVEGGPLMVKLLDFGIAKLARPTTTEKTQTGSMLGTPRYISPEQARGIDVTYRADIYSLGVLAYEMLAGHAPFEGESAMDLVVKHLNEAPPPLGPRARVPRLLEACVMRMLEKDPARRPSLAEVRQVLEDPARRLSTVPAMQPRRRPGRRAVTAAVLASAVLVGAGIISWKLVRLEERGERAGAEPPASTPALGAPATQPAAPTPATQPAAPEQSGGTLEITITGSKDAVVVVDGVERGRGSVMKVDVKPGRHAIEVRPPKQPAILRDVEVAAGEVKRVEVDVPVERTAPRPAVKRPPVRPKQPAKQPPPDEDELLRPKGHR